MPSEFPPSHGQRARRLGGNVGWLVANRLVRVLTGIVILGAIGRYLGPEQFGKLNFAIGLASIFGSVASLGFEGIIVRDLIREPDRTGDILGTAFGLRFAGGLAALIAVGLTTLLTSDADILILALIVALAFLPGAADVIELWFQKNVDARSTFYPRALATLLIAGFRLALIISQASLIAFAWSQFIEALLGAIGLGIMFRLRGGRLIKWHWSPQLAHRILRDSWPLILSGILIALYARIEQILVKAVLGDYVLGVYYAAIRVSETWIFIPSVVLATIYPALVSRRDRVEKSTFNENLQTMFDLLTGFGYVVAVGVSAVAFFAVPIIFGPAYRAAIPILIIQAWTAPILFNGAARAQVFILENLTIYHTTSALIGILANVSLSLLWMRILGAEGAALAALVSAGISACGTSYLFPRLRPNAHLQIRAFMLPFRLRHFLRTLRGHL